MEDEEKIPLLVDEILRAALRWSASDIHLEPTQDSFWIRLRLDGVLQEVGHLKRAFAPNIIARIKVMAEMLTYRTDIPQDGGIRRTRISHLLKGEEADLRVSTMPVLFGEKAVIRILHLASHNLAIASLGFSAGVLDSLYRLCQSPQGLLLFTGPAGSGKTTSIYATLTYLLHSTPETRNIVTIEDPVECVIPCITQTQVNPAAGLTFANSLRALLRQDPEFIMVGEIRDLETAQIAIQAGLTGHFVISTIHSGRAIEVFTRLAEIGIDPFLLRSAVRVVIAQRLVRLLCSHCKNLAGELPHPGLLQGKVYVAGRCNLCRGTGYQGRQVMAECLVVDRNIRSAISLRMDERILEKIVSKNGTLFLPQIALELVNSGATSFAEIQRVIAM
jgi:type II secretory ATPase GspE/PulE/Tfp pilus assembly ATPase PilB-like protein